MPGKPSPEANNCDEARINRLKPVERTLEALNLPLIHKHKLQAILNALEVQIEDGGDHPEVNRLLMEALRAGVVHQVGERRARATLRALDDFAKAEDERRAQVRAGTWTPPEAAPEARLADAISQGYALLDARDHPAAMEAWLSAWELVKAMATPAMRTVEAFDTAYPHLPEPVFNWTSDLEMELGNADIQDPSYHRHRIQYADEFQAQFTDEDEWRQVTLLRAKAEALYGLGKSETADTVYRDLIARYPDNAWGYIGWADEYIYGWNTGVDFGHAEEILSQALERPKLEDREEVIERLKTLYAAWGPPDARDDATVRLPAQRRRALTALITEQGNAQPAELPGRNDPCWCGSGKKYKYCHRRSDQAAA